MVYKEIEIDSTWQQPLGEIRVIQEEADGRELRIYLYDNGSPLDLTGKTVSVYIQKPDNTMIYNSCEVEGNQATVTLTLQMMAVSGLTKLCELQIVDTDNHTLKVTLPPLRIVKSSYGGSESRAQTNFPGWRKLSTKRTTPQGSPVKPQTRPMKQLSQRTRRLRRQILRHNLLIPQPTPQLQQRNPQIHRQRRPRRRRPMRKLKATTLKPRGKTRKKSITS